MTDGEAAEIDPPIDLVELALEWAACRRALTHLTDLTDEERAEFALLAATALLGTENP